MRKNLYGKKTYLILRSHAKHGVSKDAHRQSRPRDVHAKVSGLRRIIVAKRFASW
jgi:hypothetical protein